ncbi:MAG: OsmC family protein [Glaciecola sp.]|nr:OsmC family protein [Glaciecola sp.]MDG1814551.1 OsmC family protein [Glaciecola sp.]MDG2099517.1 OsmC family protein [Glaciecola sp.]
MQALPHQYNVHAEAHSDNRLTVKVDNLDELAIAPPQNFGGPGDQWSPEDLFMASVASCFILSFRAIARGSKLSWSSLNCSSQGTLEKVNGVLKFTNIVTSVSLTIPTSESPDTARRILAKADKSCLVANSLNCEIKLEIVAITQTDSTDLGRSGTD